MNPKKTRYTVLFAEDEEIIRNSYLNFLSLYFETVIVAKDGEEALKLYKKHNPDLVITDIVMPKIDGLTLIKMIRQNDDITRTILLTAYSEQEQLLKATELNITKYLIKPVKKQALKEALDRAIFQLEKINNSPYGLQYSIFTNDLEMAKKAIDEYECGGVVINEAPTRRFDIQPYGGNKLSGIGKEGPKYAIEEMTEIKSVVIY